MSRTYFRSKQHYCNYCNKIMDNKNILYNPVVLRAIVKNVYEEHNESILDLIEDIVCFSPAEKEKDNNKLIKKLATKYGVNYKVAMANHKYK